MTTPLFIVADPQPLTRLGFKALIRREFAEGEVRIAADKQRHRDADVRESLTVTEKEVLRLIASGKTVKEIAAIRSSSEHTIVAHKKNIFRKLGVNNVYEATRYALRSGLVEMMEYYI